MWNGVRTPRFVVLTSMCSGEPSSRNEAMSYPAPSPRSSDVHSTRSARIRSTMPFQVQALGVDDELFPSLAEPTVLHVPNGAERADRQTDAGAPRPSTDRRRRDEHVFRSQSTGRRGGQRIRLVLGQNLADSMVSAKALHHGTPQRCLVVRVRLVAVDPGFLEFIEHGADVPELEFDRTRRSSRQQRAEGSEPDVAFVGRSPRNSAASMSK